MVQSILAPTDGSPQAAKAVAFAADLAQKFDAELTLVHVLSEAGSQRVPEELQGYARIEHVAITEHDVLESVARQILGKAEQQARKAGASQVRTLIESGNPAAGIIDAAKLQNADLIVMGNRGLGSIGEMFLGSVSHKVTQQCACACVIVK